MKLFEKAANIIKDKYFVVTTSEIKITIVVNNDEYAFYRRLKYAKTIRFVRVIISNIIIKTKNQFVKFFIKKKLCVVFSVFFLLIEHDENFFSIEIRNIICEKLLTKNFVYFH